MTLTCTRCSKEYDPEHQPPVPHPTEPRRPPYPGSDVVKIMALADVPEDMRGLALATRGLWGAFPECAVCFYSQDPPQLKGHYHFRANMATGLWGADLQVLQAPVKRGTEVKPGTFRKDQGGPRPRTRQRLQEAAREAEWKLAMAPNWFWLLSAVVLTLLAVGAVLFS